MTAKGIRVEIYPGELEEGKKLKEVEFIENFLSGALSAKKKSKEYIQDSFNNRKFEDENKQELTRLDNLCEFCDFAAMATSNRMNRATARPKGWKLKVEYWILKVEYSIFLFKYSISKASFKPFKPFKHLKPFKPFILLI